MYFHATITSERRAAHAFGPMTSILRLGSGQVGPYKGTTFLRGSGSACAGRLQPRQKQCRSLCPPFARFIRAMFSLFGLAADWKGRRSEMKLITDQENGSGHVFSHLALRDCAFHYRSRIGLLEPRRGLARVRCGADF